MGKNQSPDERGGHEGLEGGQEDSVQRGLKEFPGEKIWTRKHDERVCLSVCVSVN